MNAAETLAASTTETDPVLEGIRVWLACAWSCSPRRDLADFIDAACLLMPELRQFDPMLVADVARRMCLGLEVV
jgi:hypothetical protein